MNHRLTKLKEKSGLTIQQISDKSGVAVSTVSRILSGETDNPSYRHVADMVIAMGGSLDELEGIEHHYDTHTHEKHHEKVLGLYERSIAQKNRWIKTLFIALVAFVSVFVAIVIIDVLHGDIGFVRY